MKTFYFFLINFLLSVSSFSQGSWTELNTIQCNQPSSVIPGRRSDSRGFSVGNQFYLSTGRLTIGGGVPNVYYNDLFLFDTSTNLWAPKSSLPGQGRIGSYSFGLNGDGYVMLGRNDSMVLNDCYKYNSLVDSWIQLANFPGIERSCAFTFLLNNKFYLGSGITETGIYLNDFWEYDPSLDQWTQRNNVPKTNIINAGSFSTNLFGYLIGGNNSGIYDSTCFKYDALSDSWTQITPFPVNHSGVTFSGNNVGYAIWGSQCYSYNEITNTWVQKNNSPYSLFLSTPISAGAYEYFVQEDVSVIRYDLVNDQWEKIYHGKSFHPGSFNSITLNDTIYTFNWKYNPINDTWWNDSTLLNVTWYYSDNNFAYGSRNGLFQKFDPVSQTWTLCSPFPTVQPMFTFKINQNGYLGGITFDSSHVPTSQLWKYNFLTDTWQRKADFPGTEEGGMGSFAIGNNGYSIGGYEIYDNMLAEVWKYDAISDSWSQLADVPGGTLYQPTSCVLNGKGILMFSGGGTTLFGTNNCFIHEFDPVTEQWSQINYPFICRSNPVAFSYDNMLYAGFGYWRTGMVSGFTYYDFWKFDPFGNNVSQIPYDNLMELYPNPSSDFIGAKEFDQTKPISVFDVLGKNVLTGKFPLNIQSLSNGIYIVKSFDNKLTKKFVVQH